MARKRKNRKKRRDRFDNRDVMAHAWSLGCYSVDDYFTWCRRNGFRESTQKSALNMRHEVACNRNRVAEEKLRASRAMRDPQRIIVAYCNGELSLDDIATLHAREMCRRVDIAQFKFRERKAFGSFLRALSEVTDLAVQYEHEDQRTTYYIDALACIYGMRRQWVRHVDDWKPDSRNRWRQLRSLLRHLFAKYPLPTFLDSAWFRTDRNGARMRRWYAAIGSGQNPRRSSPIGMTKKVAHHFLNSPDHYTIEQAVRWGQIHAMGGDARLCDAVAATRLGREFGDEKFWQDVLAFFVRHPLLDRAQVGPIIDYLHNQKFVARDAMNAAGRRERLPPPQPNLSMRGRTPRSLLRQVDGWHRQLGQVRVNENIFWQRSDIPSLRFTSGGRDNRVRWELRELCSHKELVSEGNAMKHCVASYARSCMTGTCSIWSMTSTDDTGVTQRRQTVEVRRRIIVQCRGRMNKLPGDAEMRVLAEWAKNASLQIRLHGF